ncbi:MAG: adenylyl-sulfate kinase [Sideroxydans sp.]|jgi:adenylylsulfate kinase
MNPANLTHHIGLVTPADRATVLAHQPATLWLTGLSASGKSTLAFALEQKLIGEGKTAYVLDGDNVRHGLNRDLGFSAEDRSENIRRIAEVAKLMNDAGLIVITAFISPFQADRAMARDIIGDRHFKEVFVSTPIAVCEQRDPKKLYQRARKGEVTEFTGITSPYETPTEPALVIDTSILSQDEAIERLVRLLQD